MRFMLIVKATRDSEAGVLPSNEEFEAMGRFNEELVKAGVLLAGEGLHPSSKGARVKFSASGKKSVVDGPFAETKELIAGYWLLEVKSREEAMAWALRSPSPHPGQECEIEVRQVFDAADFAEVMSPEEMQREENLRAELERRATQA